MAAFLQCSGWRFDGAGRCTLIPQIGDPKAHAAATAQRRACLATFPTRVKGGLLFVWLESGPAAEAEAAAKEVRFAARDAREAGGRGGVLERGVEQRGW